MKIALIGYGKMGRAIEEIAVERGHEIVLKVNIDNLEDNTIENLRKADVGIEFSGPESAFENLTKCLDAGLPVVSGSTGWLSRLDSIKQKCKEVNGSFLYASNYSIGVNIFFAVNERLAELMSAHPQYDVTIKEIHHTQKLDAPSGTAISLADQVLAYSESKEQWKNQPSANSSDLYIESQRIDPAPGTHHVKYESSVDTIEIIHTAHNRQGFASGAVLAAEYIAGRKGIFTMKDVLGI
jgi:4-hydroxy-tetrahydrodipicolinate reductase